MRAGWSETIITDVVSPFPGSYQWYHDGVPLEGGSAQSLSLVDIQPEDAGVYTLSVEHDFEVIEAHECVVVVLPDRHPFSRQGIVVPWGSSIEAPLALTNAVDIAVTAQYYMALRADGSLQTWGGPTELHIHSIPSAVRSNVVDIAAGENYFGALTSDGTIAMWMDSGFTQVHTNTGVVSIAATQYGYIIGATRSGGVFQNFSPDQIPPGLSNVVDVARAGEYHRALKSDGTTVKWYPSYDPPGPILFPDDFMTDVRALGSGVALRWDGSVIVSEDLVDSSVPNIVDVARVGSYGIDKDGMVKTFGNSFFTPLPPAGLVASVVSAYGDRALAISEHPFFVRSPSSNQRLYGGQSTEMTAVARSATELMYQWFFNGSPLDGETQPVLRLQELRQEHAGIYQLMAINSAGEVFTEPADVTVLGVPEIHAQSGDLILGAGEPLSLSVAIESNPPSVYQWYWNGAPITDATNAVLELKSVQPTASGGYRMSAMNHFGTAWSEVIDITVTNQPPGILGLDDLTLVDGAAAIFEPVVVGSLPINYEWTFDGYPGVLSIESVLSIPNAQSRNSGVYTLTASNAFGVTSASASLETTREPPSVSISTDWQLAYEGGIVTLTTIVQGTEPIVFQWYEDGARIPDATNSTLAITANVGRHRYSVGFTNALGGARSDAAIVLGRPRPLPGRLVRWYYDAFDEEPDLVVDAALGYGHWLALTTENTVIGNGEDHHGQLEMPSTQDAVIELEAGHGFSLALTTRGEVLQWGGLGPALPSSESLDRVVNISAGYDHVAALRDDGVVVVWGHRSALLNIPPGATNIVSVSAGLDHTLALRDDGRVFGWGSMYAPIAVPEHLTNVVQIAAGTRMNVALTEEGDVVTWGREFVRPHDLKEPILFGTALDDVFEIATDGTISIWGGSGIEKPPSWLRLATFFETTGPAGLAITPQPTANALSPLSVVAAKEEFVELRVDARGAPNLAVQWLRDGVAIEGAIYSSLKLGPMGLAIEGEYIATVSNTFATNQSPVFSIVLGKAPVILVQPQSQLVWRGSNAVFEVAADEFGPLTYQWSLNGTNFWGETNNILHLDEVLWTDEGEYQVLARNKFGETASIPAILRVSRPATEAATLSSPMLDVDQLRFDVTIQPEREYRLQSSSNLLWWNTEQRILSFYSPYEVAIPVDEKPKRFFRLISP